MLKGLIGRIKNLLSGAPESEHSVKVGPPTKGRASYRPKQRPRRATAFQIAWERLRNQRIARGLPVSGYVRTILRRRLREHTI